MFGLAGFAFRKVLPPEGSLSQRCQPEAQEMQGWGFLARPQPCSIPWLSTTGCSPPASPKPVPDPSLGPLVLGVTLSRAGPGSQGSEFVQWSSFPQSFWEGKHCHEQLDYRECSQPWATSHALTGIVHEPQFQKKGPVGQGGLSCVGRYDTV